MNAINERKNPLGYEKLPKLLAGYAIPSIITMLVSSCLQYRRSDFYRPGRSDIWEMRYQCGFPVKHHLHGCGAFNRHRLRFWIFPGIGSRRAGKCSPLCGNSCQYDGGCRHWLCGDCPNLFISAVKNIWRYRGHYALCSQLYQNYYTGNAVF